MPPPGTIQRDRLELIGRLLPGLAHELGNPLNSIATLAQSMTRGSQDPELQARLGKISSHTWRIQSLVSEVLALSEPLDAPAELLDLGAVLEDGLRLQRFDKPGRGVRFVSDLPTPPMLVWGVRDQLLHALLAYLMAAARAQATRPREEREVRIRGARDGYAATVRLVFEPGPAADDRHIQLADTIVRGLGGHLEREGADLGVILPEKSGMSP